MKRKDLWYTIKKTNTHMKVTEGKERVAGSSFTGKWMKPSWGGK